MIATVWLLCQPLIVFNIAFGQIRPLLRVRRADSPLRHPNFLQYHKEPPLSPVLDQGIVTTSFALEFEPQFDHSMPVLSPVLSMQRACAIPITRWKSGDRRVKRTGSAWGGSMQSNNSGVM